MVMARGWESKDIESQREQAADRAARGPAESDAERAWRLELESLELTRRRIQADLEAAAHARRKEQLTLALSHLEDRIRRHREASSVKS
jgi:hypothetical protein